MKKCILLWVLGVFVMSCNQKKDSYTVTGTITGDIKDGTQVFLKRIGENNQPVAIDTAETTGGAFTFTGVADSMEMHYLFVDKLPNYAPLVLENGDINFTAQKDSLSFSKVSGTLQNELFSDFKDQSTKLSLQAQSIRKDMQTATGEAALALKDEFEELTQKYKDFQFEYMKGHPNALISTLLLSNAIQTKTIEVEEAETTFASLTDEIKNTKAGTKTVAFINEAKKALEAEKNTAIGSKAPLFSGPNPEGKQIALQEVLGKVTLIDFWAAWCKPCRAENPNVVAVYEKYHSKGLNILGVSLDRSKDAWVKAIEEDSLDWNQISNLSYFNDEIAKLYNVNAIPAAFLLDENGVIVAKNLRGQALEDKVAELLN